MTEGKNIDKDIFNFLRRRGETKSQVLGKDDYAITVYVISFDIKGEKYAFNNYMSKKELTYKIINMLEENEAISLGEYNPNIFDENRQKVVQTVRFYLDNFFDVTKKNPINEETNTNLFTDNNHKQIEEIINIVMKQKYDWWKDFEIDRELPTQLTLKKRYNNKKIKVLFNWFDNSKHDLKKRIKERTSLKTISEFTEIFKDSINSILPEKLGVNISENGRYALNLSEYNLTLIFSIDLDDFNDYIVKITVITILPKSQVDKKNILHYFVY